MTGYRRFFAIVIIGTVLVAALGWIGGRKLLDSSESFAPIQTPSPDEPTFNLTMVQQALDRRRITTCRRRQCQIMPPPSSAGAPAVTDSVSWYHYVDGTLRRTSIESEESQPILARTPLVKPRGLFISPDNSKVAFWLDNIDKPAEQLTELWVFDEPAGGTKVLAEKLSQAGVITEPRWNRASTHLWVLGEGSSESSQIELLIVSLNPPGIRASFNQIDWSELRLLADAGPMDINTSGDILAYATPKTRRTSYLNILSSDGKLQTITVRGTIPYVEWLRDGNLLYATQHSGSFIFWQMRDGRHRRIAESPGRLQSVRSDPQGAYLAFTADQSHQKVGIFTVDVATGTISQQASLPIFGSAAYLVHAEPAADALIEPPAVSTVLDDSELANFIEQHIAGIANDKAAQQKRLVITDKPNTVFLDFTTDGTTLHRTLVTIQDAIHPEWSISARYIEQGGEWVETEGGRIQEPTALRLYEWEQLREQWILKEDFETGQT